MFHLEPITSLERPELSPYRTLRRPREHRERGLFVAEGDKVVHRLLASSLEVLSVLLPEPRLAEYVPALQNRPEQIPVYCVTERGALEALVGFSLFQGVMAIARIPPAPPLPRLLSGLPRPRLVVAADGLTSAENIGVLVRNCVAFGAQALVAGETCASPYLRRAVRNSMGAVFALPVIEVGNLGRTLAELRELGVRCLAAHPHTQQQALPAANLRADLCLVFGAEGHGISPGVMAACDAAVAIPIAATVDSLNVASAAAVFLYEARRQRQA
ncbi:MAG TPA: RNA methyltransferase [Verrucomicrobiota bacterium]|nr:RNA methyltransferase [Verrucomicrobiota bacterium]HNT15215.1 RNA methyltransferase [Verrucomicrobiota bacterium]